MKNMKNFLDPEGFVQQKSDKMENFIDSNFLNSNMLYFKTKLRESLWYNNKQVSFMSELFLKKYKEKEGVFRRYYQNFDKLKGADPLEYTRYTDPNHLSRDNSMGHIVLAAEMDYSSEVRSFLWKTIKRKMFFQNKITVKGEKKPFPDFCGPENLAIILRAAFKDKETLLFLMYPLLLVLDTFLLLSMLVLWIRSLFDYNFCSTMLHNASSLLFVKDTLPTPFSIIATKVFLNRKKPKGYESYGVLEACLRRYSRAPYDPPIYEIADKVEKMLKY
jgi:hypothetical protein